MPGVVFPIGTDFYSGIRIHRTLADKRKASCYKLVSCRSAAFVSIRCLDESSLRFRL
jgi:hypothetical protein